MDGRITAVRRSDRPLDDRLAGHTTGIVATAMTDTFHLIADERPLAVRRTRAGDIWEARHTDAADSRGGGVLLGMPTVRR